MHHDAETIKANAARARAYVETFSRDDDPGTVLYRFRDDAPDWTRALAMAAHGTDRDGAPRFLPDDYRYAYMVDALDLLDDAEGDPDRAADSIEPEPYTSQLLAWAASNLQRPGYADEAAEELGPTQEGVIERLGLGQVAERREVLEAVADFLADLEPDDDEPDDDCPTCGGTGQRATARTANGAELERHEREGTPCDDCGGTGKRRD